VYWHFVAQGGTISSTLTATFTGAGEIGPIAAYDSNGNATHFSVVTNTGAGEVLTAAVVNPATQVQLSHVCVGVEQSASASLPVASEVASSVPSGSVLAETGTPRVTPPSTDAMPGVATTTGSSWALVLVALVAVLGAALLLTPARPRR
jgi:hypothetical protein